MTSSSSSQVLVEEDQAKSLNDNASLSKDQEKADMGQKASKGHSSKLCFGKGKKKIQKTMNTAMDTKEKVASSNQTSTSAGQDKSAAATPNEHCGSVSFSQMDGKENVPNKNKNTEKEAKDQSSESHTKKKRKTTNADQDDGYTSSSLLLCLKKNKSYKKQKKCDGDKVSCIISDSASQDNSSNKDFRPDDRSAQQMEGLTSEPSSDLKCESSSGIWASFKSLAMSRSKVQKSKSRI
ncbi:uncharacterized protein LOC122803878 [Protopterus annectens]|uniref:uncharacterized protein LOC122803878 n=1 Tax=Protopterus annectens TaxID=7888 RepID=UPI001CFA99D0|nr:uncharacterized protein LOC122803878 [Protopterus annectens]